MQNINIFISFSNQYKGKCLKTRFYSPPAISQERGVTHRISFGEVNFKINAKKNNKLQRTKLVPLSFKRGVRGEYKARHKIKNQRTNHTLLFFMKGIRAE
ncbi:MAG: hypothetical protein WBP08_05675 [Saprospiraceae bacterium]